MLCTQSQVLLYHHPLVRGHCGYTHFTPRETEAQRGDGAWPMGQKVVSSGAGIRDQVLLTLKAMFLPQCHASCVYDLGSLSY